MAAEESSATRTESIPLRDLLARLCVHYDRAATTVKPTGRRRAPRRALRLRGPRLCVRRPVALGRLGGEPTRTNQQTGLFHRGRSRWPFCRGDKRRRFLRAIEKENANRGRKKAALPFSNGGVVGWVFWPLRQRARKHAQSRAAAANVRRGETCMRCIRDRASAAWRASREALLRASTTARHWAAEAALR